MTFLAKKKYYYDYSLLRPEECIFIQFNSIFCFCFLKFLVITIHKWHEGQDMLPNNLNLSDFQSLHYTCRHKHRRHYLAGFSPNSWPYALANEYYPISIDPDPFWCQSSTILFQVCHQKSYYLFSDSLAQPVCHLGNDKILFHQKKWIFYCCRDNICRWFLPRKILRFRQGIFWTNCNLFLDGQFGK